MTVHVTNSLIAVGCNPLCGVAAWASNGLVAYGADQSIALLSVPTNKDNGDTLNPCGRGVFTTLHGHQGRINAVSFIATADNGVESVVSAAADNTIRVWQQLDAQSDTEWKCTSILDKHSASVSTIAVLPSVYGPSQEHILASAASDGTICIWAIDHAGVGRWLQTIQVGDRYATALALAQLPGTQVPVLVSAGTDFRISLYTLQDDQFIRKLQLQGHTDWIRDLQFVQADNTETPELLLASASQDRYIRLWRLSSIAAESEEKAENKIEQVDAMESLLDTLRKTALEGDGAQLSTQAFLFELSDPLKSHEDQLRFSVMLEAVLQGHDDWVYSVCWHPRVCNSDGSLMQPMRLLSASADKSAILWSPDEATGVWLPQSRVGDIGGTSLGFYGALFNVDGSSILAHDYHGAFHLWSRLHDEQDTIEQWEPQVCISGHFKSAQGIAWHPKGQYLLSTSLDQTTRLFGPWSKNGTQLGWYEIARPQVHGYDLQCAAFTGDYQFASGADEKVVRVFDAPASFVRSLASLTEHSDLLSDAESRPAAANLPPLGLSNKAVTSHGDGSMLEGDDNDETMDLVDQGAFRGQSYALSRVPGSSDELPQRPPLDEQLQQLTLWPETEKLYGHGFEIITIAASHDGRYLATACRATGPEHAVVRLFDTNTWKELPNQLASHALTITKIRFSPDDRFLLTVSRDRSWTLFARTQSDEKPYQLAAKGVKAHSRIIWDASWSHDGRYFATASRDKTIKVWQQQQTDSTTDMVWQPVAVLQCNHSITAIDFAPANKEIVDGYLLGVGLEDGSIIFYQSNAKSQQWSEIGQVPSSLAHGSTVQGLLWRHSNDTLLQLATCGQDHSVRLYEIMLK